MDILERLDPFTATPQDISDAYNEIKQLREENKTLQGMVMNLLANEVAHVKVFKPKKEKSK